MDVFQSINTKLSYHIWLQIGTFLLGKYLHINSFYLVGVSIICIITMKRGRNKYAYNNALIGLN